MLATLLLISWKRYNKNSAGLCGAMPSLISNKMTVLGITAKKEHSEAVLVKF